MFTVVHDVSAAPAVTLRGDLATCNALLTRACAVSPRQSRACLLGADPATLEPHPSGVPRRLYELIRQIYYCDAFFDTTFFAVIDEHGALQDHRRARRAENYVYDHPSGVLWLYLRALGTSLFPPSETKNYAVFEFLDKADRITLLERSIAVIPPAILPIFNALFSLCALHFSLTRVFVFPAFAPFLFTDLPTAIAEKVFTFIVINAAQIIAPEPPAPAPQAAPAPASPSLLPPGFVPAPVLSSTSQQLLARKNNVILPKQVLQLSSPRRTPTRQFAPRHRTTRHTPTKTTFFQSSFSTDVGPPATAPAAVAHAPDKPPDGESAAEGRLASPFVRSISLDSATAAAISAFSQSPENVHASETPPAHLAKHGL